MFLTLSLFLAYIFFIEKGRPEIICNDRNATCYHKDEQIRILPHETKCNYVNEKQQDKCFIELTTQIYTSFDTGE